MSDQKKKPGKSLLQSLIGWHNHFRAAIDRAKKPGRKRRRVRWRSIDDR